MQIAWSRDIFRSNNVFAAIGWVEMYGYLGTIFSIDIVCSSDGSIKHSRGDEAENAKQEALECTYMLDKVNSKIAEQIFECTEGHKAIIKFMYELNAIQLEITALAELEEIVAQQRESYEEAEIVLEKSEYPEFGAKEHA
ncbi:hypothetical protein H5410_021894 [Solanum commersonii]|uniref:Uncharacterized protein n=1 Tax=Solanum commersonii TaxID=4109 RepID=A0A9J5ZDU6_SOLCO|nr:hypothetical protein H5410_021894 [Solanum commersonii]